MKLAIISDLHAFNSDSQTGDAPSHYDVNPIRDKNQCPIENLKALIESQRLCANLLLCPGDLVDRACQKSLPKVWEEVNSLGTLLGVSHTFATAGNHDIDSRHVYNTYDSVEELKKLQPGFPTNNLILKRQYWSDHFFIFEYDYMRLLVLNSSAYHTNAEEILHGRISDHTLKCVSAELKPSERSIFNVLLCHHNPQKHSELNLGEPDEIKGGQLLLDLLQRPNQLGWLVIHGHKHHPKLTYAAGNSGSPIVFSAGSLASTLYPKLRTEPGTQFYILDIEKSNLTTRGVVGTFRCRDWHKGFGWRDADSNKGLPALGGFGHREHPLIFANRIKVFLQQTQDRHIKGVDIYTTFPELSFVSPNDLDALSVSLESIGVKCNFSDAKQLTELIIL
jgi:3',5'-cyclic AMP phosphodiesterase CpdA